MGWASLAVRRCGTKASTHYLPNGLLFWSQLQIYALVKYFLPDPFVNLPIIGPYSNFLLQIYAQIKYFLPDPVANDVKYQASAQVGLAQCMLLGLMVAFQTACHEAGSVTGRNIWTCVAASGTPLACPAQPPIPLPSAFPLNSPSSCLACSPPAWQWAHTTAARRRPRQRSWLTPFPPSSKLLSWCWRAA